MKRSVAFLLLGVIVLALLVAGGANDQSVGAQEGVNINPHGNYSANTNNCTLCHQPHVQASNPEAACYSCHPAIQTHQQESCAACHDPHAQTTNASLVRQNIFGKQVSFDGSRFDGEATAVCETCHTTTRYHSSTATATHYEDQQCTKCHPHTSGFRPDPQNCTVCHGAPPPTGAHQRHQKSDIGIQDCTTCHPAVRNWQDPGHRNGRVDFFDGQNLHGTAACSTCHGNAAGVTEAKSSWSSGGPLKDCQGCHNSAQPGQLFGRIAPAVDAYWTSNGHGQGADQGRDLDCQGCHNPNAPHLDPAEYNPRLWERPPALCQRCHNDPTRAGADVSNHGNQGYDLSTQPAFSETCATCHDPHGSPNLAAIRTWVAGDTIQFFNRTGANSFDAPGDDNTHDICTVCHGTTQHNRRASNWRERPHYEGQDCAQCHKHESDGNPTTADAFMPQGGCLDCHNQPQDNGDNVPPGGRRPVEPDFRKNTHHLKGELNDNQCLVCHDQSTHGDGYVDLRAPDGGASLRFVQANQVDLTPFCQACHDDNGSQKAMAPGGSNLDPFREGANLLALSKTSTHSNQDFHDAREERFSVSCNQCHTGHGSDNLALIQPAINSNAIVFRSRTGKDSFDDPAKDDRNDLCVTCHLGLTSVHPGGDHRAAGDLDLRGSDCTSCHRHDADQTLATRDAFMPNCNACHGSPPPPAGSTAYYLDESLTPHRKHAGSEPGQYGLACSTCHDRLNPAYSGHATDPPSFQDVYFDARNPAGSYNGADRTCANVGCHSNGSPRNSAQVFQTPSWNEFSKLTCAGCHSDQFSLQTGSHARHLTAQYRDRGVTAIGCYECHADTAQNGNNDAIANTSAHVDFQKQVRMDLTDLWGLAGQGRFDANDLTCANSLCHSDGAASREQPGAPRYATPRWGDPNSARCGSCHEFSPDRLSTGAHAKHFDVSEQGPGIAACETCHTTVTASTHVNGRVDFADGKTLSQTAVCNECHSPGGAVNGVAEARANWSSDSPVSCEGCHDSQPSVIKGVAAPDIAGDGATYGAKVLGHGQERIGIACITCHAKTPESNHFDGVANSYDDLLDNFQQTRWLSIPMNIPMEEDEIYQAADYGLCYTCHREDKIVGLGPDYSNGLFSHTTPPPAGYPLITENVATAFRNERPEGYNFGNVPANIHWDHLDMNRRAWDSDGDGSFDSRPSCTACHDPHGVKSQADGVAYPAMTYADMGIVYGQDAIGPYGAVTNDAYVSRCSTCHSGEVRYYRDAQTLHND